MEDMARQTHLVRRGTKWYFRCAVPTDIIDTFGRKELKKSLGTSDYSEALKLVRAASAEAERMFEEHRRMLKAQSLPPLKELSKEDIRKVADTYYAFLLQEDEETRNDDAPFEGFYEGEELEYPAKTFEEHVEDTEITESMNRYYQQRGKVNPFYMDEAEEVLSWSGIRLEKNSPSLKAVARQLQAASLKAIKAIKERNEGGVVETPATEVLSPYSLAPPLSQARDEWFKVKAREGSWSNPRTKDQHLTWTNRFIGIIGDKPIDQYTKADGRKFRDIVSSLPKNMEKYNVLKGLPLTAIPKKAKTLGLEPMSRANVNKYITGVSALWKWISKNYDESPSNPLEGMEYRIKTNPRKERDPFTTEELNTIFRSPVFTGAKSYKQWRKPGEFVMDGSYRYWIPLIGLFTGMRLGEICQMGVEDIREEDGIHYFDIHKRREGMSLKTPHSERQIPVHPDLVKMGFMEYVQKLEAEGQERLFPDLKISSEGYYSKNASMHFQRFFKSIGVKHRKNCFHSFRHCFEDACRDSDIPGEQMDSLQGHTQAGQRKRYGDGYHLQKLNESMQKLRYRDLDLSHLHRK